MAISDSVSASNPLILPHAGMSRWAQIEPFIPVSRETWRKLVMAGKAPQPARLSSRCTCYDNREVHRWLADPVHYCAADSATYAVRGGR